MFEKPELINYDVFGYVVKKISIQVTPPFFETRSELFS